MAKSIRSKWRRKMRAIKRIRYGVKELDRLKKMLVNAGEIEVKEDGEIEHVCLVTEFEANQSKLFLTMKLQSDKCNTLTQKVDDLMLHMDLLSTENKDTVIVKAKNEEEEKMQIEKEEKSKADKTEGSSKGTPKKVQHPTWLRKKEYKKYIRSYRKQQSINAKRLKSSAKK